MLPIYWLINMSFKTTSEIINTYSLWPRQFTLENYVTIFTDSTWYMGYVNSIQPAYYQAAEIDGASRWDVFRYIELPKMKKVLTLAILLRFMDSFMIYTEPFVLTGGGPGNSTVFLSIDLVKMALGQFDLGPAAAMSLIYFFIVLLVCWIFYNLMMKDEAK